MRTCKKDEIFFKHFKESISNYLTKYIKNFKQFNILSILQIMIKHIRNFVGILNEISVQVKFGVQIKFNNKLNLLPIEKTQMNNLHYFDNIFLVSS